MAEIDRARQPGIEIGQIVLERVAFEHRAGYMTLPHTTPVPSLPLHIETHLGLTEDKRQGVIKLTLSTDREQQPLYVIELVIAALLRVKEGEENMSIERYAMIAGIASLYPFVREAVANITSRGRFGPVWLHPFNVSAAVAGEVLRVTESASPAQQVAPGD